MSGVEKIRRLNPGGIKYSSVGKLVPIPCEVLPVAQSDLRESGLEAKGMHGKH